MFTGKGSAKVCGVDQVCRVGRQNGEVEITAVGASLERAVGEGQSKGGAPCYICSSTVDASNVGVGLSSPAADIDLLAFTDQKSCGADVDGAIAGANGGLPSDVTQVFDEASDVLTAAGIGEYVALNGHSCAGLAIGVRPARSIALNKVDLVIICQSVIGAKLDGDVIWAGRHPGDPTFYITRRGRLYATARKGQVIGQRASTNNDIEVVEVAKGTVGGNF